MKNTKQLEKYFKGLANQRRLEILLLIKQSPHINLEGIHEKITCSFPTLSAHTHKLVNVGLIEKNYVGRSVAHTLSPYGKKLLSFIGTL